MVGIGHEISVLTRFEPVGDIGGKEEFSERSEYFLPESKEASKRE